MNYQADECCDNVSQQPLGHQQSDPDRAVREAKRELEYKRNQEVSLRDRCLHAALQLASCSSGTKVFLSSDVIADANKFYNFISSNEAK